MGRPGDGRMIQKWLGRLFSKRPATPPAPTQNPRERPASWPTREEIALLPPFDALTLDRIAVVASASAAERARQELHGERIVGFDTESKPIFVKGHISTGPHVAQFATLKRAYVFILHDEGVRRAAASLIASKDLKKVGFGLGDDLRRIRVKLRVEPHATIDLETICAAKGYGRGMGVKVAVAMVLKKRFSKSKKASTSNWMRRSLSEKQLLYAANDAYAPIRVYHALTGK